jgi:tetratricopeptide (TPR) repeat protein
MKALCLVVTLALATPAAALQQKEKDKQKEKQEKGQPAKPPSVEEQVRQAEEKEKAGDLEGAAELLRKLAAAPGAGGDVSLRLGRVLAAKGELDTAMDALKAAEAALAGPAKGEALGRLAALQEMRGGAEAAQTAEAAASADAAGAWPAIALSRARARQGNGDEAVSLAEKAAAAGGGAEAQSALGYAHEARGDLAAAEAAYRAAVAAEAASLSGNIGLARVLRKTGRGAEAEPLLQKVLAAAPGAVDAYKESARVKLALNRVDEAMGDAATAAALAEHDAEAQLLQQQVTIAKALGYVAQGQPDLAVQDLTALRDRNPGLAEARVGLARALVAKRQFDEALGELKKAAELKPDLAEAHYQLGYVSYAFKGDAAGAIPALEKAVAADPGNVEYRTYLGAALGDAKVGQVDRAVAELKKVAESPGYTRAEAWIYMGRAYLTAKKYKDAIAPLEKAASLAPQSPDAFASLAWSYFGLKDAENFKKAGGKARSLGYQEKTLLDYLRRVEGGEPIK